MAVAFADQSGAGGDGATGTTSSQADPIATLRERCAPEWKYPATSGPAPVPSLVTGRWLRCPDEPTGLPPRSPVDTFDAVELTADHHFFRLAIGSAGFERQTTALGDTGKWEISDDDLMFTLPPCSEGYVTYGMAHSCGGFSIVTPMFEASPSRMRFYASPSFFVKDE